ncbi:MAG: NAD-glutamate dehydrogenase, partial [Spirochaetia bacterium]|nr:NAD-glutamate dehydrogenase [Spirochaetia bacterium]
GFLQGGGYESEPHGVFFVVSKSFYGFHIRFEEIARGGIRILHSRTLDQLERNGRSLFEECFSLASTQQKKNKDIPEGGAKGVILLTQLTPAGSEGRENAASAFKKYVDAILDLLLPSEKKSIRFFPKEPELLFFGPDEGTAELMDWAARRARERGYPHWLSFTTGKSAELGGISHIDYGITTRGVREYVHELLRTLKIPETSITKVQTGGPDGDLGSNEILFSKDKTIAVIDGSGVLYDPNGLSRAELRRLAKKRVTVSHFATRLLGNQGFLVRMEDAKVRLPGGELVANGEIFRNQFHLHPMLRADLFVPCGGRPKSVNLSNWEKLLDEKGSPRFRWAVEGANLFFTQEARIKLEERGLVLFKDSSTNKGGVTSSSLEVLAALALPDAVFLRHLTSVKNKIPESRKKFVAEVCEVIVRNARLEFALLWKEWKERGGRLSLLSDELSERIISVTHEMSRTGLADDARLRQTALKRHIPESLLRLTSLRSLGSKVPERYLAAVVNRTLAKEFVYRHGLHAGFEDYRGFIEGFRTL